MSDSLSFKYTLTEEDAARALRFQWLHSKYFWLTAGLATLMFAYTLAVKFLAVMQGQNDWFSVLRVGLYFSALGVAWAAAIWFHPIWTAKRWPSVGVEREIMVSDGGMTTRSQLGYSESTWANYTGVLETDEFFLLLMGRAAFQPIPKRDLAMISAVGDFRDFLRARFTDYRRV